MFGSTELALAAYNAGPGVVKRYKKVPPISETKRFVSKIMTEYHRQKINPDPALVKSAKQVKKAPVSAANSSKEVASVERRRICRNPTSF